MTDEEYKELYDSVNKNGKSKAVLTLKDGKRMIKRFFTSSSGNSGSLCVMRKGYRHYGYSIYKDYFDDAVKVKIVKEERKSDVEWYIEDLLKWKRYILKYCVNGVWNSLKKDTESITDANLILLKLCNDEINSHYDAWKRAGEIGLPMIEGFKTTTLKSARCPYLKEIKKAFEEKRSFNYHWRGSYDYSAEGRLEDSGEYHAWFSMEYKGCGNGHYYLLLDGMHAIFAEDD